MDPGTCKKQSLVQALGGKVVKNGAGKCGSKLGGLRDVVLKMPNKCPSDPTPGAPQGLPQELLCGNYLFHLLPGTFSLSTKTQIIEKC